MQLPRAISSAAKTRMAETPRSNVRRLQPERVMVVSGRSVMFHKHLTPRPPPLYTIPMWAGCTPRFVATVHFSSDSPGKLCPTLRREHGSPPRAAAAPFSRFFSWKSPFLLSASCSLSPPSAFNRQPVTACRSLLQTFAEPPPQMGGLKTMGYLSAGRPA